MGKLKSGAKSLFTIAKNKVKGIDQSVPEEVQKERISICEACPNFTKTRRCGICGCWMDAKTRYRQEKCDDGRWGKWEENER